MAVVVFSILEKVVNEAYSGRARVGPQFGSRPARSHELATTKEADAFSPCVTHSGPQAMREAAHGGQWDLPAFSDTLARDDPAIPQEPSPGGRTPSSHSSNVVSVPGRPSSVGPVMPSYTQAACVIVGEEPATVYLPEMKQPGSEVAEPPVQENATSRAAEQSVHQPMCGFARDCTESKEEDLDLPATHASAPQVNTLIQEAVVELVLVDSIAMPLPSR
ncbi:MAG: hypothetical protein ACTJLL_01410 [Anaplasma sp.]